MTLILAKIFGIYFLALGISFLLNPERYKKIYQQIVNDQNFLFLGALFALFIGAFVISVHNHWVLAWPVIITILGWWSLIKGFGLISFPDSIKLFSFIQNRSDIFYRGLGLFYAALGLFLIYKSME